MTTIVLDVDATTPWGNISSGMRAFKDARHRQSEALVFMADRHARAGRLDEARRTYALAAAPELELAREIGLDGTQPQLRSLFSMSAVTCFARAGLWNEAIRASHEFLARPELLASPDELHALLDDVTRVITASDDVVLIDDDATSGTGRHLEVKIP